MVMRSFAGPAPPLAAQALLFQLPYVTVPEKILLLANFIEMLPGINPGVMAVIKDDLDSVMADRLYIADLHRFLARHCLALIGRMALHLGAGTHHPQIFGAEFKLLAIIKADLEIPSQGCEAIEKRLENIIRGEVNTFDKIKTDNIYRITFLNIVEGVDINGIINED